MFVWVLAPQVETSDPNLNYYYDFSENKKEFTRAFEVLNIPWKWQPVTLNNYKQIIDEIAGSANGRLPLVFNLCDGDEVNGSPGVSIVRYLRETGVPYTGADEFFYDITTSKIPMKEAFDKAGVSNAEWFSITSKKFRLNGEFKKIAKPVIIKPAISAGSIGLGVRNVVHTEKELTDLVKDLYNGYRGWKLDCGGFVAETFIKGEEYTSLIVGSASHPKHAIIYPPVQRVFHSNLPDYEKFLSFDRLWEFYEGEKPVGDYEDFFNYYAVDEDLAKEINELSWDAYAAVGGTGYGRIDIRRDAETGKLYVLEVNAQCGLSEDENYTSIGAILRLSNRTFAEMVDNIINDALKRHSVYKSSVKAQLDAI